MEPKKEIKVFIASPPSNLTNINTHIAKLPENFCKTDDLPNINPKQLIITHTKKKKDVFFQIEDKNKIHPEFYEGIKEECLQKGSGYLAMIYTKNRNEVRVLPIKNWIIFHKNVKYTDEDEYNVKVKKAEEDFLRLQKGKKGRKILMKKQEEEEEEKEKLAIDKNNDSGSEKKNSGKRKREESIHDFSSKGTEYSSEEEEAQFFEKFAQNTILPIIEKNEKPNKKENQKEQSLLLNGLNSLNNGNNAANNNNEYFRPRNDDSDVPVSHSATSEAKKDDSFDEDFPELKQNN